MEKNKKRIHLGLNCAIGALALLGSAGTIAFGTLWCQSRNQVETIVIDQYQEYDGSHLFCTSQKIDFKPNTEYKIYIDLEKKPELERFSCEFVTVENFEYWKETGEGIIPLRNPWDFVASNRHLFGEFQAGSAGRYTSITFAYPPDYDYIIDADHIDGLINTFDWGTETMAPAYAIFSITPEAL